jgi:hypothetical protein
MSDISKQFFNFGKTKITEETIVYRVFSHGRLFEMFSNKKLTLTAPRVWDDPFENFLAKCTARLDILPLDVRIDPLFKNFYGQCWTLCPESDAMWRIYSHDKNGARVSTTAGRLLRCIYDSTDPFADKSYYIGPVCYKTENEIRTIFGNPRNASGVAFDDTGRGQAIPLFIKRMEFEHEKEVRLLYRFNNGNRREERTENLWHFDINPNELFDDILFDPRMNEADVEAGIQKLRTFGFDKQVSQSTLYKVPDLKIALTLNIFKP